MNPPVKLRILCVHKVSLDVNSLRETGMKKNMGKLDRIIRVVLAIMVGALYYIDQISGVAAIVLGVFAVIFLLTRFMSFCPLYFPFKLSTIPGTGKTSNS